MLFGLKHPGTDRAFRLLAPGAAGLLCLLVLGALLLASISHAGTKGRGYIDSHNHLFAHLGRSETDFMGAAETALKEMKRYGIGTVIIMPQPFAPGKRGAYDYGSFMNVIRKYPGRFAFLGGGGSLNVMIHDTAEKGFVSDNLRREFEEKAEEIIAAGALGFGELAVEHFSLRKNHPYESVSADHPLFLLLSDIAARHNVPMDIHMEAIPKKTRLPKRLGSPNPKRLAANIKAFEHLLSYNRNTRIIWAHAGWDNTGSRTPELCRELLRKHPNLYMSFKIKKSGPKDNRVIARGRIAPAWLELIKEFPDRFIIGTDLHYPSPRVKRRRPLELKGTARLLSTLPDELARKVGRENPLRIFRLGP
jgi:predicted TIM-barrel fold metal-dependent hydrolase